RTRSGRDITADLPGFAGLAEELAGHDAVLDAELVALNSKGVPDFAALQHRDRRTDLHLYAFDVLYVDGRSLLRTRYSNRRRVLETLAHLMCSAEVPDVFDGGPVEALRRSDEDGLEGIVAKKLNSRYLPGRRSDTWIKHKHWSSDEVVIGGFTAGSGSRARTFGALLLGLPGVDGLQYVGKVGTGFSDAALEQLSAKMRRFHRKTSPFADDVPRADAHDPRWIRPTLVGEIRHSGRTKDGRFRHPAWRGLRPDKSVDEL
ncbi:MAG: ATP-dependent DNA ligase, partial [Tomitella sp.]|nr:ATP-dependent DNA ligase [Tomitella sp.]